MLHPKGFRGGVVAQSAGFPVKVRGGGRFSRGISVSTEGAFRSGLRLGLRVLSMFAPVPSGNAQTGLPYLLGYGCDGWADTNSKGSRVTNGTTAIPSSSSNHAALLLES